MPAVLLMLIEQMVMSPSVQGAAWSILKPHIAAGTMPSDEELAQAEIAVNAAHAYAQQSRLG